MGVVGNGKVEEQNRDVDTFNAIHASGMFEIHLREGQSNQIKIVADENLLDLIETEVRNNTLHVRSRENISRAKELDLYISVPELNHLDLSGAVSVKGKGTLHSRNLEIESSGAAEIDLELETTRIRLSLSGASEITMSGRSESVSVDASGASEIKLGELECKTMSLNLSGASEVKAFVTEELEIDASGASDISYRGNPRIRQDLSGAASLKKID